jgi:hypothetical protein
VLTFLGNVRLSLLVQTSGLNDSSSSAPETFRDGLAIAAASKSRRQRAYDRHENRALSGKEKTASERFSLPAI